MFHIQFRNMPIHVADNRGNINKQTRIETLCRRMGNLQLLEKVTRSVEGGNKKIVSFLFFFFFCFWLRFTANINYAAEDIYGIMNRAFSEL